jgi:hypothetical protein
MKRRQFITFLGGAAAWPLAARAQQPTERMRGRVLVAGLIVPALSCGLGVIDPGAIAQEVVGQYRWRMAMDPTVLTVEQEKAGQTELPDEGCQPEATTDAAAFQITS